MKGLFKVLLWIFFIIFVLVPAIIAAFYFFWEKREDLKTGPQIGVIWVKGIISDSKDYIEGLKNFRENSRVKAIILRVDSPGGGVSASQEIYREVERTKEVKPVVASLGSMATSGGYYIACIANKVISNPGTVTGSIGTIAVFPNFERLFEKIGYTTVVIKSGAFKDVGNPARSMTSEEESLIRDTILEVHDQFVKDVVKARGLEESVVRQIADGRILTGAKAKSLGLVDELGNLQDAIEVARNLARIEGKPEIIYYEKRKKLLDLLLGEEVTGKIKEPFFNTTNLLQWRFP
ncbi:MAG: signal peptide peptidase SppA [Syntrophobacterales bacterium]|nr:signal peptide peptidase SppA [Syntrophobacterales bacterium]